MKLFTIGPTQSFDVVLKEKNKLIPYFRTDDFSQVVYDVTDKLQKMMFAPDGSKTIVLTASGTAAMEAAVMNVFSDKDKLLVINGGTFGKRFTQICDNCKLDYTEIKLSFDEEFTQDTLSCYSNKGYTGLLVNIDETSIGKLYDIKIISKFCKENNMLLMVDAISSFLCDEYNMSENNIDVTIISSQKGLCCSPGLSFITLSPDALKKIESEQNRNLPLYYDFADYLNNLKRGQTPFTPAVGIVYECLASLSYIESIGLQNFLNSIAEKAHYFRSKLSDMPVEIPKFKKSNAVTTVIFEKPVARKLFTYLKDKYGIFIKPCGGENAEYMIRVAHIGNLSKNDFDMLIEKINEFLTMENNV
ncbi:MAG TPA: aspartate aminotransferase [Ruminococcus sp.]|nr:aspartate aminotransferase [Ruminococcus sp.]